MKAHSLGHWTAGEFPLRETHPRGLIFEGYITFQQKKKTREQQGKDGEINVLYRFADFGKQVMEVEFEV